MPDYHLDIRVLTMGSSAEVDKTLKRPLYSRHPLLRFAFTTADDLETVF